LISALYRKRSSKEDLVAQLRRKMERQGCSVFELHMASHRLMERTIWQDKKANAPDSVH
jgi:hypothetical protein